MMMIIIILFHSDVVHLNFSSSNQTQVHLNYVPSRRLRHLHRLHFANLAESSQGHGKLVKLVKDIIFIYYIFTPRFRAHKLVANGL